MDAPSPMAITASRSTRSRCRARHQMTPTTTTQRTEALMYAARDDPATRVTIPGTEELYALSAL